VISCNYEHLKAVAVLRGFRGLKPPYLPKINGYPSKHPSIFEKKE